MMRKSFLFLVLVVIHATMAQAQENSVASACYHGNTGRFFQLSSVLQAADFLGGSERVEIEISGGNYSDYGQHTYLIDARGGLDVRAFQTGNSVPGYELKIYDNGNATNHSDKYVIGIQIPAGTYRSICIRVRELSSRQWVTLNAVNPPQFSEVPFTIKWLYLSSMDKFEIPGVVRSKEVKVEAAPWPDYVFQENYELLSLEETEVYIQQNGHLPNMPSAQEVALEGIALGEMNARLLEKIEELTLYLIQQNKMLEAQQQQIECLKAQMLQKE